MTQIHRRLLAALGLLLLATSLFARIVKENGHGPFGWCSYHPGRLLLSGRAPRLEVATGYA